MAFVLGNVVKQKCGYWGEPNGGDGKEYIIDNISSCGNSYSLIGIDGFGGSSWWREEYLELISEGSINLIDKAKKLRNELNDLHSNINWIKENWADIYSGKLSITTFLTLCHEINYTSSFEHNGEFLALNMAWQSFGPIFDAVFNKDLDKAIKLIHSNIKESAVDKYLESVTEFYYRVYPKEVHNG